MIKTAIQFFKEIKQEQDKYKLVNGLFIVKYLDDDISVYVGEFLKRNTAGNKGKTNKVLICSTNQKFNMKKGLITNAKGDRWRDLNISFIEMPISEVLK